MGTKFLDEYSLLHFATGILVQYWSVPFWLWIIVHIFYEWIENTEWGMKFITESIRLWPGGKHHPDSMINRIGDIFWGGMGWLLAYFLRNRLVAFF